MRLLFDENLARRLVRVVEPFYPGSSHVAELGLASASDDAIWKFASEQGFAIVSKDADFHHLSFLHGAPPKVIWLALGNCSTADASSCLAAHLGIIGDFLRDERSTFLALRKA